MTLTDFLLARIAEDEAAAREAPVHTAEGGCWCARVPEGVLVASPGRVLAECEAKRRIVDGWVGAEFGVGDAAFRLLRLLALPYADHPDYRDEWRP